MKKVLLITCIAFALAAPARADMFFGSGLDLLKRCNAKSIASKNRCAGFVAGIADILALGKPVGGYSACFAKNLSIENLVSVVQTSLRNGRNHQLMPAWSVVAGAFANAYPCRRK
jgi:hypothetical protein